mgnify:CR=1 FL=1
MAGSGVTVSRAEFEALALILGTVTSKYDNLVDSHRKLKASLANSTAEVQALSDVQKDLKDRTELTTDGASAYAHQVGSLEKAERKLKAVWWGSRLGQITNLGFQLGNLADVVNVYSDNQEDMIAANNKLTKAQKYILKPLLSTTLGAKIGAEMWDQYRDSIVDVHGNIKILNYAALKLGSFLLTLFTIFGLVGFAIGVFSLASSGGASFLIEWTENIPILGEAMKGLASLLTGGEGDFIQHLKGGLLLIAAGMLLLPSALAPFIIAIIIGIAMFKRFKKSGMDTGEAIKYALGMALLGFVAMLKSGFVVKAFWWLAKKVLAGLATSLVIGAGLLAAGLYLMWLGVKGDLEGWMNDAAIIVGAGMTIIGLMVLSNVAIIGGAIASIPFFWIIALAASLLLIYRHWNDITGYVSKKIKELKDEWKDLWSMDDIEIKLPRISLGLRRRADGGPVKSGRTYLVGERGPELFSPSASGNITPNHELGGGGTTNNISLSIDVGGVTDRTDKRALARQISDELNKEMRRLGGQPTRGRY